VIIICGYSNRTDNEESLHIMTQLDGAKRVCCNLENENQLIIENEESALTLKS
jgi:hypothetical protein